MKRVFFSMLITLFIFGLTYTAVNSTVNAAKSQEPTGSQEELDLYGLSTLVEEGPARFGVNLSGSITAPNSAGVITTTPVALVGQFTMRSDGTSVGSRTLVTPAGPVPGGNFTCRTTEFNATTGLGKLACLVVDATTGPNGRTDTFQFVVTDRGNTMNLVLISGVPGAVVSGTARRQ